MKRLIIELSAIKAGPIRVNGWTVITNPAKCYQYHVARLERACREWNEGERSTPSIQGAKQSLRFLRACGCRARIDTRGDEA